MTPNGRLNLDPRRVAGYLFVAAVVAAPFFALIYGWNWALGVLCFALGSTTYLAVDALRTVDDLDLAPRLRLLAILNGVLTLAALLLLLARVR